MTDANQPTPAPTSGSRHTTRRRSLSQRLLAAPELGLVLVILLMGLGLTLGTIRPIPETLALAAADGVTETDTTIEVAQGTHAGVYRKSAGWVLEGSRNVYPAGTVVERRGDRIVVRPPTGAARQLETSWDIAEGPDGVVASRQSLFREVERSAFLQRNNLLLVAQSASIFAIMAVGACAVIVLGGIDLSVGSVFAVSAVGAAMILAELPGDTSGIAAVPLALLLCCVIGAACGFINGLGTVLMRVHPFVITLGTMTVFRGLALVLTGGNTVDGLPASIPASLNWQTTSIVAMIVVAALGAVMFTRTVFGRRMFAIGGNETAARYAGINVPRVRVMVFVLAGLLAGVAAWLTLGRFGATDSSTGFGFELRVIAAAVIGGTSLMGGRGSALGAVLGALIIALIDNAFVVLGIPSTWTQIVFGLTIVLAVGVDQAKTRLGSKRK